MPIDYAQKAIDTGNLYQAIATAMGSYLQANIAEMAKDPVGLRTYTDDQNRILSYANTFYSLGDRIAFANDDIYFQRVDAATKAINANVQTIKTMDKWIGFAGSVISLAASIVTGNGSGILSSVEGILGAFDVSIPGVTS
jgi:hypothetical protein